MRRAGQDASPADSAVWKKVHASVFGNAPLEAADNVVTLDTPKRAEDAAIVPLAIRRAVPADQGALYRNDLAHHRQQSVADRSGVSLHAGKRPRRHRDADPDRGVHVRPRGRADQRRQALHGRQLRQGVGRLLGAGGQDAVAAKANLGKMRLRVGDAVEAGRPALAQLMISHPNDSGLAMDQVTRSYATPHFVRRVEVRYGGKLVMNADVDFSISENPNFRFYFVPDGRGRARCQGGRQPGSRIYRAHEARFGAPGRRLDAALIGRRMSRRTRVREPVDRVSLSSFKGGHRGRSCCCRA